MDLLDYFIIYFRLIRLVIQLVLSDSMYAISFYCCSMTKLVKI